MLLRIIPLLLILSCNEQKATSEKPKKDEAEKPAKAEKVEQNSDKCAINMARLAILVQEYAAIGGTMTVDDDVDCPTDKQLQDMRHGIKVGKKHVADENLRKAQERADREEERLREWMGRYDSPAVTFRMGVKCYICEHGDVSICKQKPPEKLEEISCLGR